MSTLDFYNSVYGSDNAAVEGKPHGWLQWKGTSACVDMHCACGAHGHIDAEFFYYYACAKCGRKYALSPNIRLIELTPEQVANVESVTVGFKTDESVLEDDEPADQPSMRPAR